MTSSAFQGVCIPGRSFVSGPGPPGFSRLSLAGPCCYLKEEDEEEMLYVDGCPEPDDLGDLMKEMREGAAWADSLAIECELPAAGDAGGSGGGATVGAPEAAQQPAPLQPAAGQLPQICQPSDMIALFAAQQRAAAAAAERPPLQPGVAALLMHPGSNCGGSPGGHGMQHAQSMIPVGAPSRLCLDSGTQQGPPMSCAASLAATTQVPDGCAPPPGAFWPPPVPPTHPGQFFPGQPPTQPQAAPPPHSSAAALQQTAVYPLPLVPPGAQAMQAPPLAFFQSVPAGFDPPANGAPQLQHPLPAFQVGSVPPGAAPAPGMLPLLPASDSNSSGDGSDGTTIRLRNSFDSDGSGSGGANGGSTNGANSASAHHLPHQQHPHHPGKGGQCLRSGSGSAPLANCHPLAAHPAAAGPPQQCSAFALAAFDQAAALDCAAGAGAGRQPYAFVGASSIKCEAPSDSSDVEDNAHSLAREYSGRYMDLLPQVVPDALCYSHSQQLSAMQCPYAVVPPPAHMPSLLPQPAFLPATALNSQYYSPAAQTARVARQASLERYRLKKARRGFGKKIRYQARKVNADKRPRIKGRFVKAVEAAGILAAASAAAAEAEASGLASTEAELGLELGLGRGQEQGCCCTGSGSVSEAEAEGAELAPAASSDTSCQ